MLHAVIDDVDVMLVAVAFDMPIFFEILRRHSDQFSICTAAKHFLNLFW